MAASAASEVTDGPVLSLINKRLRALRKKYNRILQMEEGIAQGKPINKEQEEVLRSKPTVAALIDEFEKLRQPLTAALQEELKLTVQHHQVSATPHVVDDNVEDSKDGKEESGESEKGRSDGDRDESILEDLLNLLYFASLFDVKPQSDFTSTMLTRTHERGCCLTYDYVTDDATDLLGERDLDMISMLGSLLISRPVHSILSHKNALRSCVQHAKLWLSNSDQPIEPGAAVTYTGLRERLNRILASDYFTTTPEMKAPVEVAAAAGKYAPCQAPVQNSVVPSPVPVQAEGAFGHYHDKEEENSTCLQEQDTSTDQSLPVEEPPKDEPEQQTPAVISVKQEQEKPQLELEEQSQIDLEAKEQQYIPRRTYQNQRGRGGGRRGYANGRGGRSGRSGGGYQNGRSQYYDQPGNYYPRNYYNTRGRGGRGAGGYAYNSRASGTPGGHAPHDVEQAS
ncbi:PREDICTED: uncharacterized protein LOC104608055 isoform X2 [Nelumbo nucifera]|uniref:Uncharacterized protein LOC104608055 isoform X2 n=1 Tax=Nelumbo nucifera TaxID=4432 RepID=A0A1U8AVP3_NELNU|nr:PREDICTED: uncharacterized protein LOC104608055 isoform X2 [Nelumbo nucifera]